MNYSIQQIHIFLKVVQTVSITKAADELHLTQPAVSIQLKNFQKQFDIPLWEVINKKIYITNFGFEIAEQAKKIIEEIEVLNNQIHKHKGLLTGKLKFSVVSTGKYIAPYFINEFMQQHKEVDLYMDVTNKVKVVEALSNNLVDFCFVTIPPENINIKKIELLENKLYLVGNKDMVKSIVVDKNLLHKVPMIYREEGSGTRHVMENFLKKNKISINKKMELTSNEAVKQAVIAGLGFSIMPLIGIKNEIKNKDLQIVALPGFPIKSHWYLIWLADKKMLPAPHAFLSFIKKNKGKIVEEQFNWYANFC